MSVCLRKEFVKEYIPKLQQCVFSQLLDNTREDMKKETRATFKDIGKLMKKLLTLIMSTEEIEKIFEGKTGSLLFRGSRCLT